MLSVQLLQTFQKRENDDMFRLKRCRVLTIYRPLLKLHGVCLYFNFLFAVRTVTPAQGFSSVILPPSQRQQGTLLLHLLL